MDDSISFDRLYESADHLLALYDRDGRSSPVATDSPDVFAVWREQARSRLCQLSGIDRMQRCPLAAQVTERVQLDGMLRQRVVLQTEPDVWMPLYVLIPERYRSGERLPALIAAHGHGVIGKYTTAGRTDLPAVRRILEHGNEDYGAAYCRRGYVVFCPDARGFGERRELHRQGGELRNAGSNAASAIRNSCSVLARKAAGLGQTVIGMWTWDLMRLLDYIGEREECDSRRVGCVGSSAGGWQTLWLSALDERVAMAVISGNFFGFRDSLLDQIRCDCSYVPRLLEYYDTGDIAALIAPRPLLVEVGTKDVLCGRRGAVTASEQIEICRQAYELLGAGDRLHYCLFEGPHGWNGAEGYPFTDRWLA